MKAHKKPSSFNNALAIVKKFHATKVTLSVYNYIPNTVKDDRKIHTFEIHNVEHEFKILQENLQPGEDIAFHSRIFVDAQKLRSDGHKIPEKYSENLIRHIPLIDCATDNIDIVRDNIKAIMRESKIGRADIYHSGQSYHVYLHTIKTGYGWNKFMGRLLLMNHRNQPEIIDSRWVGHRLLAGYSALRVTNNGKGYKSAPTFIESLT